MKEDGARSSKRHKGFSMKTALLSFGLLVLGSTAFAAGGQVCWNNDVECSQVWDGPKAATAAKQVSPPPSLIDQAVEPTHGIVEVDMSVTAGPESRQQFDIYAGGTVFSPETVPTNYPCYGGWISEAPDFRVVITNPPRDRYRIFLELSGSEQATLVARSRTTNIWICRSLRPNFDGMHRADHVVEMELLFNALGREFDIWVGFDGDTGQSAPVHLLVDSAP